MKRDGSDLLPFTTVPADMRPTCDYRRASFQALWNRVFFSTGDAPASHLWRAEDTGVCPLLTRLEKENVTFAASRVVSVADPNPPMRIFGQGPPPPGAMVITRAELIDGLEALIRDCAKAAQVVGCFGRWKPTDGNECTAG